MPIAKRFVQKTAKEQWQWRVDNARHLVAHYKKWKLEWKAKIFQDVLDMLLKKGPEKTSSDTATSD